MRRLLLCASLMLLSASVRAADAAKPPLRGLGAVRENGAAAPRLPAAPLKEDAKAPEADFIVSFKARDGALERAGKLRVSSGSQANYVAGGEDPIEITNQQGAAIEWKKRAFVLNLVVVEDPNGGASGELQLEISGIQPADPKSQLRARPVSTMQLQTRFHAGLGKPAVLVDEPDRRLEITLERAP